MQRIATRRAGSSPLRQCAYISGRLDRTADSPRIPIPGYKVINYSIIVVFQSEPKFITILLI